MSSSPKNPASTPNNPNDEKMMTMVPLKTEWFRQALERYIDENKPDPLSRKQLEGWTLEWTNDEDLMTGSSEKNTSDNVNKDDLISTIMASTMMDDNKADDKEEDTSAGDPASGIITTSGSSTRRKQPDSMIRGTLQIGGEHILVTLFVTCLWSSTDNVTTSTSLVHGELYYQCHATAQFQTCQGKKLSASEKKIRSRMMARLKQDSYLSKILVPPPSTLKNDNSLFFIKAKIRKYETELEERVYVSDTIGEALKRAVWSSAESPLDVVELFLQFPCLPTTTAITTTTTPPSSIISTTTTTTTPLANRAKLRLLEEAMVDACEQEGEDQMINDLQISAQQEQNNNSHHEDDDEDDDENHPTTKSRKKLKSAI